MAHGMIQFALQGDSGLPEDVFINTFHFAAADVTAVAEDAAADLLKFYNDDGGEAHKVSDYLGSALNGDWSAKVYDMGDPEPRVPVYTTDGSGIDVSSSALPSECSVCLSFEALPASGEPQARRRGRVFIGPLSEDASTGVTVARPAQAFIDTLCEAAGRLISDWALHDMTWSVYSRVDDALVSVAQGWVDNAFDTQRRRGERATARTTWEA